jgi:hypothetical protein
VHRCSDSWVWSGFSHHLEDDNSQAEDVATRKPLPGPQCFGWYVTRSASTDARFAGPHGFGEAKIDYYNFRAGKVCRLHHEVWFLDVTMDHGLFVHELKSLEALPEHVSPPFS